MRAVRIWVFMPYSNDDVRPGVTKGALHIRGPRRSALMILYALILERLGEEMHRL